MSEIAKREKTPGSGRKVGTTSYTEVEKGEIIGRLCEWRAEGRSLAAFAKLEKGKDGEGPTRQMISRWANEPRHIAKYQAACRVAWDILYDDYRELRQKLAESKETSAQATALRSMQWELEKLNRDLFGRERKIEVEEKVDDKIKDMSDEELARSVNEIYEKMIRKTPQAEIDRIKGVKVVEGGQEKASGAGGDAGG